MAKNRPLLHAQCLYKVASKYKVTTREPPPPPSRHITTRKLLLSPRDHALYHHPCRLITRSRVAGPDLGSWIRIRICIGMKAGSGYTFQ